MPNKKSKTKTLFKNYYKADLIIKIPLWKSVEFLFGIPAPVLLFWGGLYLVDYMFNMNLVEPDFGNADLFVGLTEVILSFLLFYRMIAYRGIIFKNDSVIIPPVKFHHLRKKIIFYNEITDIGYSKFEVFVYCGDKKITITKHNNTNKLWTKFLDELYKRHEMALKAMGKHEEAKDLYESDDYNDE